MTALAKLKSPAAEIAINGAAVLLDLSGALLLPDEGTLLVADLHLEKGSSFARRGQFLPPYDTRATLANLAEVIARLAPRRVVALGDSFHDTDGPDRLPADDAAALRALQMGRDWIWITGNHDTTLPPELGGEVVADLSIAGLTLCHEPRAGSSGWIAGHLHPVGKVAMRGRAVRRRCFVGDGTRLVMPAFGAYAGGLNVCDAAFKPLFPEGFTAHLLGDSRIFTIGRTMLCRD